MCRKKYQICYSRNIDTVVRARQGCHVGVSKFGAGDDEGDGVRGCGTSSIEGSSPAEAAFS
jgi:hypothetical protein